MDIEDFFRMIAYDYPEHSTLSYFDVVGYNSTEEATYLHLTTPKKYTGKPHRVDIVYEHGKLYTATTPKIEKK